MRIGLFSDTYLPEINGVASSTAILRDYLTRAGHEVFVITTGTQETGWEDDGATLRLSGKELSFLYGYIMTLPVHSTSLEEISRLDLDIIHAQTEFGVGLFARLCAKTLGIPLVSTYHTTYEDYTHYVNFAHSDVIEKIARKSVAALSRMYGDSSEEVIAPSLKTKQMLERYGLHRRISVIPTGLDLTAFMSGRNDRRETRKRYGYREDEVLIIYVGRIAEEKSLDIVLEGFLKAGRQGIPAKLLVVGGGPQLDALKEYVSSHDMKNVVFAGPKPREEVPALYRMADAFVSASLSETQGMTYIEALASGIPILVRHDDVVEELVEEGKTGWYFRDAGELAAKLKTVCAAPADPERISACMNKAMPYSGSVFAENVLEVYERCVQEYQNRYTIEDAVSRSTHVLVTFLANDGRKQEVKVSLDDYAEYHLKKGKLVSGEILETLLKHEIGTSLFERCVRRISLHDRTEKEVRDWLRGDCDEAQQDVLIARLREMGLLDDARYAREMTARMKASRKGEGRIRMQLRQKGIAEDLIEEVLAGYEDERDNAVELAEKMVSRGTRDSARKTRNRVYVRLMKEGYSLEDAAYAAAKLDEEEFEKGERENLRRCALKAKVRYSRKHAGIDLRRRVYQYCLGQGYDSDDIREVLSEMDWADEED